MLNNAVITISMTRTHILVEKKIYFIYIITSIIQIFGSVVYLLLQSIKRD